jgi:Tfp pilus assembly protein PilV
MLFSDIGRGMDALEGSPRAADRDIVKSRACGEDGFGLIELLIAMVMLNVGILAIVAAFSSGIGSLARASHISTASTLADQQMELYRGLTYGCIYLSSGTIPVGGLYVTAGTSEGFYSASQITSPQPSGATCASPDAKATNAQQLITGPDRHRYEVDTYIVSCPAVTCAPTNARTELKVSVSVRDALTGHSWARVQSTFDQSTGS